MPDRDFFLKKFKTAEHKNIHFWRGYQGGFQEYVEGVARSRISQVYFNGIAILCSSKVNFKGVARLWYSKVNINEVARSLTFKKSLDCGT